MSTCSNGIGGCLSAVLAFAVLVYIFGGGFDKHAQVEADKFEKQVNDKVITDAKNQYNMVKRNGNEIEASVYAGFVAAACLQAGKESEYRQWSAIAAQHDKRAQAALEASLRTD